MSCAILVSPFRSGWPQRRYWPSWPIDRPNDARKPQNLVYARRSRNPSKQLSVTTLTDVWGIGRRWARRLETEGWQNAADLATADPAMIRLVANVVLQRIALELRESPVSPWKKQPTTALLVRSRSFGRPLYQLTELRPALGRYLQRGWEHLRRHHLRASGIQVFLHTSRFHREVCYFGSRQAVIEPTDDLWNSNVVLCIIATSLSLRLAYTRCGIMLFGLEPDQLWNMDTTWQPRTELQQAITGSATLGT